MGLLEDFIGSAGNALGSQLGVEGLGTDISGVLTNPMLNDLAGGVMDLIPGISNLYQAGKDTGIVGQAPIASEPTKQQLIGTPSIVSAFGGGTTSGGGATMGNNDVTAPAGFAGIAGMSMPVGGRPLSLARMGGMVLKYYPAHNGWKIQTPAVQKWVRARRMNPLNPHALSKSLHRLTSFSHFAKRVMHFVSPKKHATGFKFHHRRASRRRK